MGESLPPLMLCMQNAIGEEVTLRIEPEDDFHTFLEKAKSILGSDININSITGNQVVSLTDNIYQFLSNKEQNPGIYQTLTQDSSNDLVYILNDGTQIRASQIHFDNDDPPTDLTTEKIPFVKYVDNPAEELQVETDEFEKTVTYNIVGSPIMRRSSVNSNPESFTSNLPFKLVCNNTLGFEAQFTKYLEANSTKTYATINRNSNINKSPRSLLRVNYTKYEDKHKHISDNFTYTREEVLNMFKNSPVNSLPYESFSERKHVRKTDPFRIHKAYRPVSYDIDGLLISDNGNHICFICGKKVDKDKLYLFDNEDQKIYRRSSQKKSETQLKIICEGCLTENFMPCRMKGANQFLGPDEYLVIKNNQQFIFKKVKNIDLKKNITVSNVKINSNKKTPTDEFVKVEIGSDGEIITKPVDEKSDDVILLKEEKRDSSSSDVEIIEPETEIDTIIDNLDDADEDIKAFLGKYQCDNKSNMKELKCRFCEKIFTDISEVMDHGEIHKHNLDDDQLFPCPLCYYGYAHLKWLKGHIKAAHENTEEVVKPERDATTDAVKNECQDKRSKDDGAEESNTKTGENSIDNPGEPHEKPELEVHAEVIQIKTEANQEEAKSSDDEIWIVQTADDEASKQLQNLFDTAKIIDEKETGCKLSPKCLNCSQIFPSVEALAKHKCRRRGRKRKRTGNGDNTIRIPTREDFIKRAQGRPRFINTSADNSLLVERIRKNKTKEPTSDPQILTCDNCNESFTSKVRLKFHMQFHELTSMVTAEGQYTCLNCPESKFPTETSLFDHVHFQHDKQKRWQCPVRECGKTFHLRATLTKHSRTHTDTRRYVCVTCGKRFLDKQTLDEHGVTHLQIKPFECHICRKQLTRRSRLRMHLRAHEEELSPTLLLVCRRCGRAFRDSQHAQEHAATSTECIEAFVKELKEEPEEADIQLSPTSGIVRHTLPIIESPKQDEPIPRQVASPLAEPLLAQVADEAKTIIRVVEIEKAFRCEYCEDVFYLEESLNEHRAIHKGVKNPFTCHICKVSFATYSRCTTHKTTHGFYKRPLADVKRQAEGAPEAGPSATGILGYGDFPVVKHFLCEDCGRSYLHWTYLQVHRRMKHANENLTYACNHCDMTFPNSWSVAYHRKKIHGNIGPMSSSGKESKENYRIQCRDCEEILPNKTALYKHRKEAHSAYKEQGIRIACKVHQAVGRDNTCPDCVCASQHAVSNIRFTAMRNHRLIHSGVRAWACARCPKRFRIRSELRTHLRLKHPVSMLVIEVIGLNPSHEDIMSILAENDISREKVSEITRISFPKGTTSIVPNSARALSMLSTVPRTQVACGRPAPERIVEDYRPARRGRGLCKTPGRFQLPLPIGAVPILEQAEAAQSLDSEEGEEDYRPARRGRGLCKTPGRFQLPLPIGAVPILEQAEAAQSLDSEEGEEGLPDLNSQLPTRDSSLLDGAKIVQLQFEDTMILE